MRYDYPHTSTDKLIWQERFLSPEYTAANRGTVSGALTIQNGVYFDGTAKYIDYTSGKPDWGFPTQWTMLADIILYDLIGDFTIVSRDATAPTSSQFCVSCVGGRLKMTIAWSDGTYSTLLDQINHINVGVRQQVAITYDGTTLRTYVCGVSGSTLAVASKKLKRSAQPFRVGARASVGYENYFKGTIKELRLYSAALALADMQSIWLDALATGAALSVPPIVDGLVLWVDARTGGTPATQPTRFDISDITKWNSFSGAAFATITGYSSAGLQVSYAGVAALPFGRANVSSAIISTNRYYTQAYIKNDGSADSMQVAFASGGTYLSNSTSTWVLKTQDLTVPGTAFDIGHEYGANVTSWLGQFSDFISINLSRNSITPSSLGLVTAALSQSTDANKPWIATYLGKQYLRFNGDTLAQAAVQPNLACTHNGLGSTIFLVTNPVTLTAGSNVYLSTLATSSDKGIFIQGQSTSSRLRVVVANGSGVYSIDTTFNSAVPVNTVNRLTIKIASGTDGVSVRRNGLSLGTATFAVPASTGNPSLPLSISSLSTADDRHAQLLIYNRTMTAAEVTLMEAWLATEYP